MGASMHFVSMQRVIIVMRPFMDFIMDASIPLVSMQRVIIIMRSFMDFIMDALIGMEFIGWAVMHCAMHWEITAWKSQSAFSIRMSMHFDGGIMVI
jgi:hypothetical protein